MDMKAMMRKAQKMQADLAKAQDEIKEMSAEATAGGGMVAVVAKGDMTIQSITIQKEAVDPEDVELLQDMVTAAVNEALRAVSAQAAQRMSSATGGINIPGLT
ncbi:MAG: YbaB/EbfC family nucleoid-associated protein [Eggerthellaceae bacterium]|nr:YbaB/EbfC family nucleoid-associated protein [Eggerthellaceae bacterium]